MLGGLVLRFYRRYLGEIATMDDGLSAAHMRIILASACCWCPSKRRLRRRFPSTLCGVHGWAAGSLHRNVDGVPGWLNAD